MAKKRIKPMTQLQERFVEAFLGEAYFDPIKAYELAGYAMNGYNKYTDSMKILHSDAVTERLIRGWQIKILLIGLVTM